MSASVFMLIGLAVVGGLGFAPGVRSTTGAGGLLVQAASKMNKNPTKTRIN
ncbi:MAG TPA: hypothetical protein VLA25_05260 [Methylotenera sp.]|nr:hypothetical protein [Methylotenera sp.]